MAARGDPLAADFFVLKEQGRKKIEFAWNPVFDAAPMRLHAAQTASNRDKPVQRIETADGADRDTGWSDAEQLAQRHDRRALWSLLKK
jgi:hypothetical protein